MDFTVDLRLRWDAHGRLTCGVQDWSGNLDDRQLALAEAIAAAMDSLDCTTDAGIKTLYLRLQKAVGDVERFGPRVGYAPYA